MATSVYFWEATNVPAQSANRPADADALLPKRQQDSRKWSRRLQLSSEVRDQLPTWLLQQVCSWVEASSVMMERQ